MKKLFYFFALAPNIEVEQLETQGRVLKPANEYDFGLEPAQL